MPEDSALDRRWVDRVVDSWKWASAEGLLADLVDPLQTARTWMTAVQEGRLDADDIAVLMYLWLEGLEQLNGQALRPPEEIQARVLRLARDGWCPTPPGPSR